MRVELDVLGSQSLTVRTVSVDVKQHLKQNEEFGCCVKVEVDVLGSPSLKVRTVSVDVKQHLNRWRSTLRELTSCVKVDLDVLASPFLTVHRISGRKATLKTP